jgi:hypothetical protein
MKRGRQAVSRPAFAAISPIGHRHKTGKTGVPRSAVELQPQGLLANTSYPQWIYLEAIRASLKPRVFQPEQWPNR